MSRKRRFLLVLLLTPVVLICSGFGWYVYRLIEGEWMVHAADTQVEALGGYIGKGLVNGDFYVHLEETQIDDDQFEELVNKLRWFPPPFLDQNHNIEIYASNTRLTDRSIPRLRGLSLRALDLRDTAITDASAAVIAEFNLWKLDLSGTKVTDAAVPELSKMRLMILGVSGSQITPTGREQLKQELVHTRVQ